MKILAKLLAGFLSVALLCVVVGIFAITQVKFLEKHMLMVVDTTIPTLNELNGLDIELAELKAAVRSLINPYGADDQAFIDRQMDHIRRARDEYKQHRAGYEKLSQVPEEKRLYAEVMPFYEKADVYTEEIITAAEAARKASGGDRDVLYKELYEMISDERRLAFDDLQANLEKVLEYDNGYYGEELPHDALDSVPEALLALIAATILAFIAAAVIGFFLGRSISGSLRKAVIILDNIAAGDVSARLEVRSKDEFKQVAESLNSVAETIEALVAEAGTLSDAAVSGRLLERGNPDKFKGSYRDLVVGVNDVIDGLVGFLDNMPTPAMIIDASYQVLFLNKAGASIGAANGKEVAAGRRKCYDFFKTGDCKSERCACSQTMRIGGSASSQTTATPLEKTYEISYAGIPVTDRAGKIVGAFETIIDQTAIKRSERKMIKIADFQSGEIRRLNDYLMKAADGDLSGDFIVSGADQDTVETKEQLDLLASALNKSFDSINEILAQVAMAVDQVNSGSRQVSQASQSLSQGATEQASSLEEITASITEISAQTRLNTENAVQVNGLAKTAKADAEQGNVQMNDLVSAMSDINKSAEEIKKIVKAIDDISFQINLLALNANVEAARAGKYGKGFAVVAEEVRNLAVRSAGSVKETTEMVDEAIANIVRGNELVAVTAKQLDSIMGGAAKVSRLSEEVAIAGREQAQGLEQISGGLNQIDQVTQENTASAEQSATAAEELAGQAEQLKEMISRFKLKQRERVASQAEMIAMLRAELAAVNGGHAKQARALTLHKDDSRLSAKAFAGTSAAKSAKPRVNPSDVISLDDDDFGKF